jgi:hypothetical protein
VKHFLVFETDLPNAPGYIKYMNVNNTFETITIGNLALTYTRYNYLVSGHFDARTEFSCIKKWNPMTYNFIKTYYNLSI